MATAKDVTRLLQDWSSGDEKALEELIPLVYGELRRLAERSLRRERAGHTLQPTALVNEAYLRLIGQERVAWQSRAHFLGIAAKMMRRILIDHARRRRFAKRGRDAVHLPLEDAHLMSESRPEELLALDAALERLAAIDPRKGRVVELRIFGGLTIEETARTLGVAIGTVINDYRAARAWLFREIAAPLRPAES